MVISAYNRLHIRFLPRSGFKTLSRCLMKRDFTSIRSKPAAPDPLDVSNRLEFGFYILIF
jgi:hypothetical protein